MYYSMFCCYFTTAVVLLLVPYSLIKPPRNIAHLNRGAKSTPRRRAALRLMIGSIDASAVDAVSIPLARPATGTTPLTQSQEVA